MNVGYHDTYIWIELQHLDYNYIIGNAYASPWAFLKLLDIARGRGLSLNRKIPVQDHIAYPDSLHFVLWQQIEFSSLYFKLSLAMRERERLKLGRFMNRKIKVFHKLLPIGSSSQSYGDLILDMFTNQPLGWATGKLVCVDAITRRPTPFPKHVKEHFDSHSDGDFIKLNRSIEDLCTKLYEMPQNVKVFQQSCLISAHNVDINGHANQSSYAELCFDCIAGSLLVNCWPKMKHPIWNYPVRRISLLYIKECTMGDKVNTFAWPDGNDDFIFHFHIRKNEDILCQAQLQFFPPDFVALKAKL